MVGQVLIYGLITATQVLFIALALYIIRLVSNSINFALGGIAAAVAYALYFSVTVMQWPVWFSILFSIAAAFILSLVNYYLAEPLNRRQQPMLALLVSITYGISLEAIIALIFNTDSKSLLDGVVPTLQFGAYQIPVTGLAILIGGLLVASVVALLYFWTPFGRTFRAIAENHFVALGTGINQPRYRLIAYAFAGCIAGAVGILLGLNTALIPTMGSKVLAMGFIALLVGGLGDVAGTVVATYLLVLIPELVIGLVPSVSANWQLVFVFLIAVILLLVRPRGLFARTRRAY